ncbi:hypothetical protein XBKQ1_580022 [Xenorhabdus bovienii str. kraussei Quebec]|uniref:Uncharacterized protein n=7 Tax=Xenorhabdus bovienii TaxID=40576 RepID=A0A077PAZ2_XENBV|nr:hypothetical protein XBFFR1_1490047 [Xenorhabdus bovienii str. feltiae France]CDG92874.1 hypothetical protein XBFFL1_2360047 [Xenorhabdus bovienii str. feltiae Florida]CDG98982.1 hypothetical protein XBP1_650064 [Xenorhabdus bovienii str. puntauvense]CDH02349.1 hypothetical protein XBFM1_2600064 [Xenorhabdus bovienii str. feltiae Moldova]CDH21605.1 hypothetical protein XBKQ1_580022 [Xenorhabdus bovienii str. kraussei Quebec]CDH25779.1 hypothetical protein XBKB1_4190049 [Xenorhabdus bovienii
MEIAGLYLVQRTRLTHDHKGFLINNLILTIKTGQMPEKYLIYLTS